MFLFSSDIKEFEKQRLGSIRPLEELLAEGEDTDEEQWRTLSETRFGLTVIEGLVLLFIIDYH